MGCFYGIIYRKRFGTVDEFSAFANAYISYLIESTVDENVLLALDNDPSSMEAIIAHDVQEALEKLPVNPWLKEYIEQLELFII